MDLTGRYGDLELKRQLDRRPPARAASGRGCASAEAATPPRGRVRFIVSRLLACLIVSRRRPRGRAGRRGARRLVPGAGLQGALHGLDRQGHVHRRRRHDLRRRQGRPHDEAAQHVRMTGINAMEQSVYSSIASRRRGECHALEATSRLEQLIRRQPLARAARGPGPGEPLAPAPAPRGRRAHQRPLARRRHDHGRRGPRASGCRTARSGRGTPATARSPSRPPRRRSASGARPTAALGPSDVSPLRVLVNADADGDDDASSTASGSASATSTPSTRSTSAAGGCATRRCAATSSRTGRRCRRASR